MEIRIYLDMSSNKIIMPVMANIYTFRTGRNGRECELKSERAAWLSRQSRRSGGERRKPQRPQSLRPQGWRFLKAYGKVFCIDKRNGDRTLLGGNVISRTSCINPLRDAGTFWGPKPITWYPRNIGNVLLLRACAEVLGSNLPASGHMTQ